MKKWMALLLCVSMLLSLFGCHKTRESSKGNTKETETQSETQAEEPLQLYYVTNEQNQSVVMMLGWYRTLKDSIKVEAVPFASAQELQDALVMGEEPDLILLDKVTGSSQTDPFLWIREGYVASVEEWINEDEEFDRNDYIAGTLEAGMYQGQQYILPLSVSNQYLLINEEELKSGALSNLGSHYTMQQLMDELVLDAQNHEGEDYFTHIPFYFDLAGMEAWIYEMLELTGALHVNRDEASVEVEEEQFAATMTYMKVLIDDANRLYSGAVDMSSADFLSVEGYCTAVLSDRNASYMTRYMSSACHQLLGQEMTILPYALSEEGYAVNVNVMGMVGAESDQKEEAYQVLHAMMNIPKEKWETINMDDTFVQLSSVNKTIALDLVESFRTLDKGNFRILGTMIQRETLTEDQAATLRDMIENNQAAYIVDQNIVSAIEAYVYPKLQMENVDWAQVAQDTAHAIESGM